MKKHSPKRNNFELIETILWENNDYFLLNLHLERLGKSARYFSFRLNPDNVSMKLKYISASFRPSTKYRVRLLLKKNGETALSSEPLKSLGAVPARIAVSDKRTDRNDPFLRHKTTRRFLYDRELSKYRAGGFFDVVFLNRDNEITEGAMTNIVIKKENTYYTPPVNSGLLAGVYREYLLRTGKLPLKEKVLYPEDLSSAAGIFMVNSVRKMVPAALA